MDDQLTQEERLTLLTLARQALQAAVCGEVPSPLHLELLPPPLRELGASFVTLTCAGELRGCIGALEPYLPLAEDVRQHAVAAALEDYRFLPVTAYELPALRIEISRLTLPKRLDYEHPQDLPGLLHPQIDGVVIRDGLHRATFLPQVWEKLPDPVDFLGHLCQKMGAPGDLWRFKRLKVFTYQVEEFQE
jgi:AmmeMemoRadiSam system protein A